MAALGDGGLVGIRPCWPTRAPRIPIPQNSQYSTPDSSSLMGEKAARTKSSKFDSRELEPHGRESCTVKIVQIRLQTARASWARKLHGLNRPNSTPDSSSLMDEKAARSKSSKFDSRQLEPHGRESCTVKIVKFDSRQREPHGRESCTVKIVQI